MVYHLGTDPWEGQRLVSVRTLEVTQVAECASPTSGKL